MAKYRELRRLYAFVNDSILETTARTTWKSPAAKTVDRKSLSTHQLDDIYILVPGSSSS